MTIPVPDQIIHDLSCVRVNFPRLLDESQSRRMGFQNVDVDYALGNGFVKANEILERIGSRFKFYVDMRCIPSALGDQPPKFLTDDHSNGRCKVWLVTNVTGGDHLPMTAWIMMHRTHHTTIFNKMFPIDASYVALHTIARAMGLPDTSRPLHTHVFIVGLILSCIMTTRAARNNNITSTVDLVAELFAQHHFTGVRFKRDVDIVEKILSMNGNYGSLGRACHLSTNEDKWLIANRNRLVDMIPELEALASEIMEKQTRELMVSPDILRI